MIEPMMWRSKTVTTTINPMGGPEPREQVHIYTDGSCLGDPAKAVARPGGYAWVQVEPSPGYSDINDQEHTTMVSHGSGGFYATTNNRMEMYAVIDALKKIGRYHPNAFFTVHTDSQLIVNAFGQGWINNWRKNGYKTSNGKPVENQDLWESLTKEVAAAGKIRFVWVKGHSKVRWNEWCDNKAKDCAMHPTYRDTAYEEKIAPKPVAVEPIKKAADAAPKRQESEPGLVKGYAFGDVSLDAVSRAEEFSFAKGDTAALLVSEVMSSGPADDVRIKRSVVKDPHLAALLIREALSSSAPPELPVVFSESDGSITMSEAKVAPDGSVEEARHEVVRGNGAVSVLREKSYYSDSDAAKENNPFSVVIDNYTFMNLTDEGLKYLEDAYPEAGAGAVMRFGTTEIEKEFPETSPEAAFERVFSGEAGDGTYAQEPPVMETLAKSLNISKEKKKTTITIPVTSRAATVAKLRAMADALEQGDEGPNFTLG